MFAVTLPNGAVKNFDQPVSVADIALSIGTGLAKATIAGKVDGTLVDASSVVNQDANVVIVTDKDPAALEVVRHSAAHLLAQAAKRLFPKLQVTIGPVIEDGFYYDFAFERSLTDEDLVAIEQEMQKIVKEDLPVSRSLLSRSEAIELFKQKNEHYKVEIISDIPSEEGLSFYKQGEFIDLCRGPHVPSTGKIKAFKLLKVAGAYWRGDAKNEMLQRVYGTAFLTHEDLAAYLHRVEEAEKRDHRKLAKKLDLFHMQEEAPGMIFWHPKGWALYQVVEQYMRRVFSGNGYCEVRTPQLVDKSLWEKSGHWEMFGVNMFAVHTEDRIFAMKPMNCPCHIQIFNQGTKSYRDLPLRLAEFGSCHRNEPSGTLHGLLRVRNFVQDDAHIFCTEEQIQSEVAIFIDLLFKVYKDFGFNNILIKLSTRPTNRIGTEEMWDNAEKALELALNSKHLPFEILAGEGAFYGPKLEFSLKDSIGRVWQCGTMQVDLNIPERLGARYIAEDGTKKHPVMLHRAIVGSLERFVGILIEEHAGSLPIWLAPIQVAIFNITDKNAAYAQKVSDILENKGLRVLLDLRNEKIGFKIREHTIQRVPYLVVVGDKEMENGTVSVRTRTGKELGVMLIDEFVNLSLDAVRNKQLEG